MLHMTTQHQTRTVSFCFLCLLLLAPTLPTQAKVLYVAAEGRDDSTCRGDSHPCRSIGQATAHANEGDALVVGPGRYGDINGDGDLADPGEDGAEVAMGCHCLINLDKPLTVESSAGPAATIIDAGDRAQPAVQIDASY